MGIRLKRKQDWIPEAIAPKTEAMPLALPQGTPLTDKQERFCREYVIDLNGTQAAIRAGYAQDSAEMQACRLLRNDRVRKFVDDLNHEVAQKLGLTAEKVQTELAKLGFSNMQDYMKVDGNGYPHLDFSAITRDQAAALTEVQVDEYMDGQGEEARQVKKVKFKLADKRAALVDLGRHLGMFRTGEEKGEGRTDNDVVKLLINALAERREKRANAIEV